MALRAVEKPDTKTGGIAADRLRSIVDRIERLEEERKALGGDIRDIYAEAKSAGFDVKVLRQLIRVRRQEAGGCGGAGDAARRVSTRTWDVVRYCNDAVEEHESSAIYQRSAMHSLVSSGDPLGRTERDHLLSSPRKRDPNSSEGPHFRRG